MINKFLEMLGVELGEKFDLVYSDDGIRFDCGPYRFEGEYGNFNLYDRLGYEANEHIADIISGYFEIKKLPWKPKDGDKYYYISIDGDVFETMFSRNFFWDLCHFKIGNCFRTKEDAEAHKSDISEWFDEIKKELDK